MQSGARGDSTITGTRFRHNWALQAMVAGCALLWVVAAVEPYDRFDWFLENLLVFVGIGILVAGYRVLPLSNLSYGLIAVFSVLHIIGSHYTYAMTPAGFWLQDALNLERNHYDRVVHFCFGLLLAHPVWETLVRSLNAPRFWPFLLTFAMILAVSNLYETIEWCAAEIVSPDAAMAFLGTQGDVFDAQKDAGLAGLGAIVGLAPAALLPRLRFRRRAR